MKLVMAMMKMKIMMMVVMAMIEVISVDVLLWFSSGVVFCEML